MRSIKVFSFVLVVVGITTALGFFGFQNMDPVSVKFFHWRLPEQPLFIYLLLTGLGGMVISALFFAFEMLRLRSKARKESKLRARLEAEVNELRNRPLYDDENSTELELSERQEGQERDTGT